jgi:hypothetical protein
MKKETRREERKLAKRQYLQQEALIRQKCGIEGK